jgi:hypothetical protein
MIGEPMIPVMCDRCAEDHEFGMTALACHSWDARNLQRELERGGWRVEGDIHICPDCVADEE